MSRDRLSASLCMFLVGAALLACSTASADSGEIGVHAQAVQLAHEGAVLYKDGKFAEALAKYAAAYRTFPAPALVLNLSRTELKLGHCDAAIGYARTYEGAFGTSDTAAADSPQAWLSTLQVACPEVAVTAGTAGAQLFVDDEKDAMALPWKGHLLAGEHRLVGRLAGHPDQRTTLIVTAGRPAQAQLVFPEIVVSPQPIPPAPAELHRSPAVPGWAPWVPTLVAVGGLALAIGEGVETNQCSQSVNPVNLDSAGACQTNHAVVANTGWTIAGVGAATAVVLWVVRLLVPGSTLTASGGQLAGRF